MSIEITSGEVSSQHELVHFANKVFGAEVQPGGFSELLPKWYASSKDSTKHHLLLREGGEIRGMLLCAILPLCIGGTEFLIGQIGTVAVDSSCRGKGYMGLLLEEAHRRMIASGCVLSTLGGQRQRYGHFGYELAGMQLRAELNRGNVSRLSSDASARIHIVPMAEESPYLGDAYRLYEKQGITCQRTRESFFDVLRSWRCKPYAILQDEQCIGCVTLLREEGGLHVVESLFNRDVDLQAIYLAVYRTFGEQASLRFTVAPYDTAQLRALSQICESYTLEPIRHFRVFSFAPLMASSLALKSTQTPLADGEMAFAIEEERFVLRVQNNHVSVHEYGGESKAASFTKKEATRLFLSPISMLEHPASFVPGWFPLPLHLSLLDLC